MGTLSNQIDENLAYLTWSLWTEIGVAGLERRHRDFSIAPEELIILTAAFSKFDPRLRDEALDWCIHFHRFISLIRLHILAKEYEAYIAKPFSTFSATMNALTDIRTKWTVLTPVSPLKFQPSGKSILRNFDNSSMVNFRLRSFLGVGAKSDVLVFLLTEARGDFVASDLLETGYSKRRLAMILRDLALAGVLSETPIRNQLRYSFVRRDQLIKLLGEVPKKMIHWHQILAVFLPIRACLQDVESASIGVRVVDMRNLLNKLASQLSQLKLKAPPLQKDFESYWNSVAKWLLDVTGKLARGDFPYSNVRSLK